MIDNYTSEEKGNPSKSGMRGDMGKEMGKKHLRRFPLLPGRVWAVNELISFSSKKFTMRALEKKVIRLG